MRTTGLLMASAALLAATAGWAQSKPKATTAPPALADRELNRILFRGEHDNMKISLNLEDIRGKEALKSTLESAGKNYVLDPDVPEEPRVTLKVKDVRLSTALDLLTEALGVGWRVELRDGKPTYRVGKSILTGFAAMGLTGIGDVVRHGLITAPEITAFVPNHGARLHPYIFGLTEERSTFTCPHCKGTTTLLRQRQQPKCTKCQRAFQSDWQFCPADGAKRPAAPNQWKFCPHCGKDVKMEKSEKSEAVPGREANERARFSIGNSF